MNIWKTAHQVAYQMFFCSILISPITLPQVAQEPKSDTNEDRLAWTQLNTTRQKSYPHKLNHLSSKGMQSLSND